MADTPAGGLLPIAADDDEAGGGREAVEPALLSIALLQKDILSSRLANPDQRVLRLLMGLDAPPDATIEDMWPSQRDVAEALGLSRTQVADVVSRARTRWGKKPSVTTLRDDVAIVLGQLGGVATHSEVARALIQGARDHLADRGRPATDRERDPLGGVGTGGLARVDVSLPTPAR
ncbi:MAG: hypothetical protein IPN47_19035 [Gemmatimonadetes bacterium]|nr:hypothetical protein [Gemmatimonadota bacterium]